MAISIQTSVLAWRRVSNFLQNVNAAAQLSLQGFKSYLLQQGGNPDLEFVPFDELSSTDVVIADAACTLYAAVFVKDTTTATFAKFTDHASTGSDAASEIRVKIGKVGVAVLEYPQGLAFANGITGQGTTTADGGTGSASNGASGFALIGAA